jgi:hypothetical protein
MDKAFTTTFSMSVMEGLVERLLPEHRKDIYKVGFGCLLHLPQSAEEKLSIKFHCWLLCNIDAATRTICDGQGSRLQLTREQVHSLTLLPMGNRRISLDVPAEVDDLTARKLIPLLKKFSSSARNINCMLQSFPQVLEMQRENPQSRKVILTLFIALVVKVFLAPNGVCGVTHGSIIAALAKTDKIRELDWCTFVIDEFMCASTSAKDVVKHSSCASMPIGGSMMILQARSDFLFL